MSAACAACCCCLATLLVAAALRMQPGRVGAAATSPSPLAALSFSIADALENYTQIKAVYQSLEPNQAWL